MRNFKSIQSIKRLDEWFDLLTIEEYNTNYYLVSMGDNYDNRRNFEETF